jgi:hypothetical protein
MVIHPEKRITEDPDTWTPFNLIKRTRKSGSMVEPASDAFAGFQPFERLFNYRFVLDGNALVPVLRTNVHGRNHETVAGFFRFGQGVIVFAPDPSGWSPGYLDAIANIRTTQQQVRDDLPEWAERFQIEEEQAALARVAATERKLEELAQRIAQEREAVQEFQRSKALYAGTGAVLVEETANALRQLGLRVVEGPNPHADLLIWDGRNNLVAAEVKGLDGAAATRNARQANSWAADVNRTLGSSLEDRKADPVRAQYAEKLAELGFDVDVEDDDLICQGLMVIGTFRKTPLDERLMENFPDPVAKAIARWHLAALTGLDLYCLVQEAKGNPSRKAEVGSEIMTLRAVMQPKEWRKYIEVSG